MSAVRVERDVVCSSDRCSLWNLVTDTERLNRVTGGERLDIEPNSDQSAARYITSTNLGGFSVQYEERPYEWVYLQSLRVFRVFRGGPVTTLEFGFHFTPLDSGGTSVKAFVAMEPKLGLMRPILKFRAAQTLGQMAREIERIDRALVAGQSVALPPQRGTVREGELERAASELKKHVSAALVDRLVSHVRDGADYDVSRTRPYQLADQWGLDRREVLVGCLHAVKAGLLELRWEVLCPSCRVASSTMPSLSQLSDHATCQLCDLAFAVDLDQAIEASFAPCPAVRQVDAGPYCISSPQRLPHVVSQSLLPSKGAARLVTPDETCALKLFVRGGASTRVRVVPGALTEVTCLADQIDPHDELSVAPGGTVVVQSSFDDERHAKLERPTSSSQAASARDVTSLAVFRREFTSDLLRPGISLKVSRVTLLFTDLTGSTKLYAAIGDALAFKLVQDHFDVVLKIIEDRGGALVKTMGDAVMAVFSNEDDAMLASIEVLRDFDVFRASDSLRAQTHIKLGIFSGPCYVITANDALDYFGQTVNIAARMQAQADSGELVVEGRVADAALASGRITPSMIKERYAATLKGVDGEMSAVRITRG